MTEQVQDITDLPTKNYNTKNKIRLTVAGAILVAGVVLLIDDQVKKLSRKKSANAETPKD